MDDFALLDNMQAKQDFQMRVDILESIVNVARNYHELFYVGPGRNAVANRLAKLIHRLDECGQLQVRYRNVKRCRCGGELTRVENPLIQKRIEQAARRLLQVIDADPWRITAATFGLFAQEASTALDELRKALDAPTVPLEH